MQWYKFDIGQLSEPLYEKYLSLMSDDRRKYVNSLKHEADRKRTVAAEMLVKTAFCDDGIEILKDPCGKPYVKDSALNISIAHSGDFAVCAVSENLIGIDIEKMRDLNLNTAEKFCNQAELDFINECDSTSRFFEIWTAKEAYYKMHGGILKSFKEIDTTKINKKYFYFLDYTVCVVE